MPSAMTQRLSRHEEDVIKRSHVSARAGNLSGLRAPRAWHWKALSGAAAAPVYLSCGHRSARGSADDSEPSAVLINLLALRKHRLQSGLRAPGPEGPEEGFCEDAVGCSLGGHGAQGPGVTCMSSQDLTGVARGMHVLFLTWCSLFQRDVCSPPGEVCVQL